MTTTTSTLPLAFAQAFAGFAATAARFGKRVVAAWRHRGDFVLLSSLDDRMLRDIGLTRGDLNDALAEPLWRDPTAVLVRRQRERRSVRLAGAVIDLLPSRATPSIVPAADASALAWNDRPRRLAI
ncbi:MAG TPA: DUF1127 domain-containing protein [Xanthobacteraceae bacterium]|nr:DUF1127 domain-containing protein [Xanthobacteraceae bacterium]